MIKCAYRNILETSTVSLSAGAEDSAYPLYRLYDRDIGRIFKPTAAVTIEVKVDQGASPAAVDRLLIPAGHNLDGQKLDVHYSDDDVGYTWIVPQQIISGSGLINLSWTPATHRYWKIIFTDPTVVPQFAEIFLTSTYEWELNPKNAAGPIDPEFNVENNVTAGGQDRFLVHGNAKQRRRYRVEVAGETQKQNVLALYDAWAGSKPFWLEDLDGVWIYGKLRAPLNLMRDSYQLYSFDFDFIEVLP